MLPHTKHGETSLHRSLTEPAGPASDAAEEEWESGGEDSGEIDDLAGAVTNDAIAAPPALSPNEEGDAGLELQLGRRSGNRSKETSKERGKGVEGAVNGMTATQPRAGGAVMEKTTSQTGLPAGGQAMSRQGSKQSQIGFDTAGLHGKDSHEGLHRVPTIGFDVGMSKEEPIMASSDDSTAKVAADISPLHKPTQQLDDSPPTNTSAALAEPSLLKAERSAFIVTPSPGTTHSAPEQATTSEPQRSHRRESTASTQQGGGGGPRHVRTRNSHTSLRSLLSLRAPPHPLNSPTHARSRVSSMRGGAPPVVNIEPAKAVWSGKDVKEEGEGDDDDDVGLLPTRSSGGKRSTSAQPGIGGNAEVSLRKASFSSIRDLPSGTQKTTSGMISTGGGGSAAGTRLSAHEQLANSASGLRHGGETGGRPGSIHGSIGSSNGSGSTGRVGASAVTTTSLRDEWDQSHLVSRFLPESQRQRRRPRKGQPDDINSNQSNLIVPFPQFPIVKAHASLVLNMREEKQMYARSSSVRGGPVRPSHVPGLSPFEMSMQRVLAQRAVAVSTSGLAGLGIED